MPVFTCSNCGRVVNRDDYTCYCGARFRPDTYIPGWGWAGQSMQPYNHMADQVTATATRNMSQLSHGVGRAVGTGVGVAIVAAPILIQAAKRGGKAKTALICGILGLILSPIFAIVALVQGNQALKEIRASGGRLPGESDARTGITLGWVGLILQTVFFVVICVAILIAVN